MPLVVLTHFHADHVDGLEGVLHGRRVGAIEVTSLADPVSGVRLVRRWRPGAGVPVQRAAYGESRRLGPLRWQVIAPSRPPSADSESPPNDTSIVMLVETRGLRILLMGDEEDTSQARAAAETGGVRADVLKVAHHGSARQDPDLVRGLGARLAVISVGRRQRLRAPGAVADGAAARDAGCGSPAPTGTATWPSWWTTGSGSRDRGKVGSAR